MKKTLLIGLTLSSSLLLTACGSKEDAPTNEPLTPTTETEQTAVLPDTNDPTLSDNNELTMDCKTTIQTYLAEANLEGQGETIIQANDSVVVDYIGRLDEENVFDTSVEKVAKACGKYTEWRDYNEGLPFTAGSEEMIPGFSKAVIGMKVGQTKTVNIPAAEAYGERSEEYVQTYPLSDVPNPDDYVEGMQIAVGYGMNATITKKTDKEITLDFNHELAGKNLIFDITIKSIN